MWYFRNEYMALDNDGRTLKPHQASTKAALKQLQQENADRMKKKGKKQKKSGGASASNSKKKSEAESQLSDADTENASSHTNLSSMQHFGVNIWG